MVTGARVSVGVGTRATFHLDGLHFRAACLAGMQMKGEATDAVTGTVTAVRKVEGEATHEGKQEFEFDVREDGGAVWTLRRSRVKFTVLQEG